MSDVTIKGSEFFSGSTANTAKVTADGELAVTSTERERNVLAHYQESGISATKYVVLIDRSDTTNFPHDDAGRIDISFVRLEIEKSAANTQGDIKLGLITRIDGTDADIDWLWEIRFEKGGDQFIDEVVNFAPSQIKFDSSKYITNDSSANVAAVNTGVTLDSPRGASTVTPAVGDVIVGAIFVQNGTYDFDLEVLYHGEP